MTLDNSNLLLYGAIAGLVASVIFVVIHHLTISPIYFILPFGGILGALTGMSLVWSYRVIFGEFTIVNTTKLFGIYLLPMFVLEILTFFFLPRTYTMEEAMASETGPLLALAFSIVIPFGIVYGIIQGFVLGGSKNVLLASVVTNFVIFVGIGHNLPLFNAIALDDTSVITRIKVLILFLLIVLYGSFAISLHILMNFSNE